MWNKLITEDDINTFWNQGTGGKQCLSGSTFKSKYTFANGVSVSTKILTIGDVNDGISGVIKLSAGNISKFYSKYNEYIVTTSSTQGSGIVLNNYVPTNNYRLHLFNYIDEDGANRAALVAPSIWWRAANSSYNSNWYVWGDGRILLGQITSAHRTALGNLTNVDLF